MIYGGGVKFAVASPKRISSKGHLHLYVSCCVDNFERHVTRTAPPNETFYRRVRDRTVETNEETILEASVFLAVKMGKCSPVCFFGK